jgi:hypothetical protein
METTSLALEHLLCAVGDPIREMRDIGPEHPEFVCAQTIRAAAGVIAKVPDALPGIAKVVRMAPAANLAPRARTHLAAAEAWLAGDPLVAAESYALILRRWPMDLLALRLAQSCDFFLGRHDRMCEQVDSVLGSWNGEERGYRFVLTMASFAYAESGDTARAESLGWEALSFEPACPMGIHAVAHAFAASGRHAEGARWMRERRDHWAIESRMRTHNAWHLAMFDVERGEIASALAILDETLLPASAGSSLDACDAVGLLWRLALEGVDSQARWLQLSEIFDRFAAGFWPYVDLHMAFVHANAGKTARLQRLAAAIARCAQGNDYAALRARLVTLPGLQALAAWGDGLYAEAADRLASLRPILGDAGGSRIQLELFTSIEREARRRDGRPPERKAA